MLRIALRAHRTGLLFAGGLAFLSLLAPAASFEAAAAARPPTVIAATGFLVSQFGPLFRWPEWALDISVFRLYGTPLTAGVYATGLYVEVAVLVIGFGLALVTMRFRDVGD